MIYAISELLATAIDSIIFVLFLVYSLSYKRKRLINLIISWIFAGLFFLNTTLINSISTLEGMYTISYFIILFLFCRISLKGKWWHQLLLVIVALAGTFLVNTFILITSSFLLKQEYSEIILMRNPARIFFTIYLKNIPCGITFSHCLWCSKTKNYSSYISSNNINNFSFSNNYRRYSY